MKKLFIAAIAVFGFATANAQYKAEKGDLQTSVDFRPFNNNGKEMFENIGINASYFLTDKDALRLGLNFGLNNTKEGEKTNTTNKTTNKSTLFGIGVGYERHFGKFDRLDIYAGAEAEFSLRSNSIKSENNNGYAELKGSNDENLAAALIGGGTPGTIDNDKRGYTAFGVGVFTGANFYVYKKLYVGAEIEFAFANTSYKKIEASNGTATAEVAPKASGTALKFQVNPALRLGWTF